MTDRRSSFGARLRRARLAARFSQADLSDASGIPKPTLSRYENDHVSPSLHTLERLASSLGVSEGSLLGEVPTPHDSFLQALADRGITFDSVSEAESAADELVKLLDARARAV